MMPHKMEDLYIQERTFDKTNFTQQPLATGEYEDCTFNHCDFSGMDLSYFVFSRCTFSGCNLSMVKLTKTAFQEVVFKDCKMLGVHFDTCNPFGLSFRFENCILNHSSFYQMKIKKTVFNNTQLHEADFTDCDLSHTVFSNCDFSGAIFDNTIMERADFRSSFNYALDPEKNKIKKARFSIPGVVGLLSKYGIEIE
jgi:fluoroquinolone resistance protein